MSRESMLATQSEVERRRVSLSERLRRSVVVSLKEYRKKRNFKSTLEPKGNSSVRQKNAKTKDPKKKYLYVIQKHAARHLHYDLRLEINNVLKSWAIPKGPHLNPNIKRLAVEVEDHPMEYGSFEGTIPEGEYGAGTVMLWDKGEWIPENDPLKAYQKGDLTFQIKGKKLKGKWKLIKIKDKEDRKVEEGKEDKEGRFSANKKHWLFFKLKDPEAKDNYDVVDAKPLSVLTHKDLVGIAKKNNIFQEMMGDSKKNRVKRTVERTKKKMPTHFKPELCFLTKEPPETLDWIHEIKFDGYRIIAFIDNEINIEKKGSVNHGEIKLLTRNGLDWTGKLPGVVEALKSLTVKNAILDGELVVLDDKGKSNFQLLQNSVNDKKPNPLCYYLFDLPYCNNKDLSSLPLIKRKIILKELLQSNKNKQKNSRKINKIKNVAITNSKGKTTLFYSDHVQGKGNLVYRKACQSKLEGIVSKYIKSPYEQHRSKFWLKSKCLQRQEFVIGGFTPPKGSRQGFGSLLLGLYNNHAQLIYHGHVGTGFDSKVLKSLHQKLKTLIQSNNPFDDLNGRLVTKKPKIITKDVTWVKPILVAELKFSEWTTDHLLRHPVFLGLRIDKNAKQVKAEKMIKQNKIEKEKIKTKKDLKEKKVNSTRKKHQEKIPIKEDLPNVVAGIELSHPNKIIEVNKTISKLELANYYQEISSWILPHVMNRPLSLLRCPSRTKSGSKEKSHHACFFQKHHTTAFDPAVYSILVREEKGKKVDYIMIKNLQGLIALVQMNVIEIHPWGSYKTDLEKPDRMIFDLDPGPGLPWQKIINGALLIRNELKKLGLTSYVKTSGGKGLHVVIPIEPKNSWIKVKAFSETFSRYLGEKYPNEFTATLTKTKRQGKIYIDYLRNSRGATAVAPYSTRAIEGAPISMPVSWSELKKVTSSQQFTVGNISRRLHELNNLRRDPWKGFFQCKQGLPKF